MEGIKQGRRTSVSESIQSMTDWPQRVHNHLSIHLPVSEICKYTIKREDVTPKTLDKNAATVLSFHANWIVNLPASLRLFSEDASEELTETLCKTTKRRCFYHLMHIMYSTLRSPHLLKCYELIFWRCFRSSNWLKFLRELSLYIRHCNLWVLGSQQGRAATSCLTPHHPVGGNSFWLS